MAQGQELNNGAWDNSDPLLNGLGKDSFPKGVCSIDLHW